MTPEMWIIDSLMHQIEKECGLSMLGFEVLAWSMHPGAVKLRWEYRGYYTLLHAFNYLRDEWLTEYRLGLRVIEDAKNAA